MSVILSTWGVRGMGVDVRRRVGACVAGEGHVWWGEGVCMAGGVWGVRDMGRGCVCGMGVCMVGGVHGHGTCMAGGGAIHGGGACMAGGMRGRRDGHCSRWYASY